MHHNTMSWPNKWRRIKALVIKEFYQVVRDSSSILIAFIFPLILLFVYGVGVSLDIDHLRIGLVMQDTNPQVQSFACSLKDSTYFDVEISRDQKKLERKLMAGKLRGLVVVPFYFSLYQNEPAELLPNTIPQAPIFVIADGSEPNTAHFVQNYVHGAWGQWLSQQAINYGIHNPPYVSVRSRFWFNENLDSRNFLIPGSIAIIMALVGSLLTALVIAREWERGTMEALLATPVTMREFYMAKIIAYFCLGMISMVICTLVATLIYRVPFRGSFIVLTISSAIFLMTALGTGLLISCLTRSQFLASQVSIITAFLPAFMLSGFVYEISSMPTIIRAISCLISARYFVSTMTTLYLAGTVWELILIDALIMLFIASIFFGIIFSRTKKRLD